MLIARRFLRNHWGKALTLLTLAAALGVLWWALPVRPRVAWAMPNRGGPIDLSADGQFLLTHSREDTGAIGGFGYQRWHNFTGPLQLWNTKNGEIVATLFRQGSSLRGVALAPNGQVVAVVNGDGPIIARIFDLPSCREIGSFQVADSVPSEPLKVRFSPDSQILAVQTLNQQRFAVVLWDVGRRQERATLAVECDLFQFSADSRLLATALESELVMGPWWIRRSTDQSMHVSIWDVATGQRLIDIRQPNEDMKPDGLAFDQAGAKVGVIGAVVDSGDAASLGKAGSFRWSHRLVVWDVATGSECVTRQVNEDLDPFTQRNASLDSWYFLQAADRGIDLLHLHTGKEVRVPYVHRGAGARLWLEVFGPAGCDGSSGSFLSVMRSREMPSNSLWKLVDKWLTEAGFGSTCWSSEVQFWNLATGSHLATIHGNYFACRFSANGRVMAAMNGDERLEIWDIPPRKPLGWFLGLAGLLLLLTLGGFWWQARRRKRKAALATEAIPCSTC
jgi:WD40 repeat protein